MSLPIAALIKNRGQKTLEKIVNEVMEDMSCYISGLNVVTPQETRLIQTRIGFNFGFECYRGHRNSGCNFTRLIRVNTG